MAGTKAGALKAALTRKEKYGADYHAKIGAKGGAAGKGKLVTQETRRKISKAKKFRNKVRRSISHENNEA